MQQDIPTSGSIDKSKVLNVKPLRSLVPIFPTQPGFSSSGAPHAPPFMCTPPTGPFPPGVAPFYPFSFPSDSHRPPEQAPQTPVGAPGFSKPVSKATPISSFRTPVSNGSTRHVAKGPRTRYGEDDGFSEDHSQAAHMSGFNIDVADAEYTDGKVESRRSRSSKKRPRSGQEGATSTPNVEIESLIDDISTSVNQMGLDTFRRTDGDKDLVVYILMAYDMVRRKINQIEDAREASPGVTRRPDLRAGTLLMNKGIRTNVKKRIGAVPGVEVGDIFFFRMETCLVGLHAPAMSGIDYMSVRLSQDEDPVAVSIVAAGGYGDNMEDADVLIYSGSGGNANLKDVRRERETTDQKLERGNLALEKSLHRANEVRVIRGMKDVQTANGRVYVYDGVYKIHESWIEKAKSGCNMFKYKLIRVPGQPEAFNAWKSVQQWKEGATSRVGLILPDLTSGAEILPVSLVNDVDDEKGPAYFTYISSLKYTKPINSTQPSFSCTCLGGCLAGDLNCSCIQKNGGFLPYTTYGVLVNHKALVRECGTSCPCPPTCRNRVSQAGLRVRLEVFRTKDKGWGLRSWDPIRSGGFVCEYAGEVIDKSIADSEIDDDYVFDATRGYEPPELITCNPSETQKPPFPLVISAKDMGNVARFMNHSCSPNLLWRPVLRDNNNGSYLHIAFFAIRHIPPLRELTFDYGVDESNTADQRRTRCLCGSAKCRGYFC